jgi:hypothetical protein
LFHHRDGNRFSGSDQPKRPCLAQAGAQGQRTKEVFSVVETTLALLLIDEFPVPVSINLHGGGIVRQMQPGKARIWLNGCLSIPLFNRSVERFVFVRRAVVITERNQGPYFKEHFTTPVGSTQDIFDDGRILIADHPDFLRDPPLAVTEGEYGFWIEMEVNEMEVSVGRTSPA